MKKRIIFGLAGLAIMAAAVTATVTSVNVNSPESDILSKNIEALTETESGSGVACYASIEPVEGGKVVYCGTCNNEEGYGPSHAYGIQPLGNC